MSRVTLILVIIILIPVLLIGALMFLLANPDYYRAQLATTFLEETGLELDINGDMRWRYLPPIALSLSDIAVRPEGSDVALASIQAADVDLSLWALISGGNIAVNGISIDGLTINALVDTQGNVNWETGQATPVDAPTQPASGADSAGESAAGFGLDISQIVITNTTINYRDASPDAPADYTVSIPVIRTGSVLYDEPTATTMEVIVTDNLGGMRVDLDARGDITFNSGFTLFQWTDLELTQTTTLPDLPPLESALTLDGNFDVDAGALQTTLAGTLGSSKIDGNAGMTLGDVTELTFALSLDRVNVLEFTGETPTVDEDVTTDTTPPEDVEVLPLDTLNGLKLSGELDIGTLTYDTWTFSDVAATVDNRNGQLNVDANMQGYQGSIALVFDGSTAGAGAGHTRVNVDGIDVTALTEFEWITGTASLESNTTFTGNMLSDVINSLDGTTTFNIANGTLDVTPIKAVAALVDNLRGKDSGIGSWPDKMPFDNLNGQHRFVAGTQADQQFNFVLENMTVTGNGGFDCFANQLTYDVEISLEETTTGQFRVSPGLARIDWPLHCEGAMDASPVDLCFPNRNAIRDIIADVAKQEVKRKATEKIEEKIKDKIPTEIQDRLKNLFNRDG